MWWIIILLIGLLASCKSDVCEVTKDITICSNLTLQENKPLRIRNYTNTLKLKPPLKELPAKVFFQLRNLKTLIVNYTLVEKIFPTSFSGLKNLQNLDLYWNQIANIPVDAFRDCTNLIYLNLGGNNLENINGNIFAHLKHLKKLIISSNLLNSIPNLSTLEHLELLDLSKNKITTLQTGAFRGLIHLIDLNLKFNKLARIETNAFSGLTPLKYLNLANNHLERLDAGDITGNLPHLQEIQLQANDFSCEKLQIVIENFHEKNSKINVPEGEAEPGPITYHGIFCLPRSVKKAAM